MRSHGARSGLRLVGPILAVMIAAGAVVLGATPARADDIVVTDLRIITTWEDPSRCLDARTQDPTKVQVWNCTGADEQQWRLIINNTKGWEQLQNKRYGTCVTGVFLALGEPPFLSLRPCTAADDNTFNQLFDKWQFFASASTPTGLYAVEQNVGNPNTCISRTSDSLANGTLFTSAACQNIPRQRTVVRFP